MYQQPKCPYLYFLEALEFYLTVLFPMSIPKKQWLGNIGNESIFKINSTDKSRTLVQYFNVFLFGKICF